LPFDPSLIAQIKNVHTYAATPFCESDLLKIDTEALAGNIEFLIEKGVRVVAVGGGTGEIETLNPDELELIASTALKTVGNRALVINCCRPICEKQLIWPDVTSGWGRGSCLACHL